MTVRDKLISYYSIKSKHSNYQILPNRLKKMLGEDDVQTRTRFEVQRISYILEKVPIKGKSILDIGGNTGFFTFELINAGAMSADCYEGNREHAEFVKTAAKVLGLHNIRVLNKYFSFDGKRTKRYDVALLLNVLHHIGDDYGDKGILIEEAKKCVIRQLNSLKNTADILVFQLGFNWQGDPKRCLFEGGTKQEMINYVEDGVKNHWDIEFVGVAELIEGKIKYSDLNKKNIKRDDSLGEFLNRPIFILKSKTPHQ
jgi:hypothetical protein